MPLRIVKMVSVELEDTMATGTVGAVCCGTAWFVLCIKCRVGRVDGGAICRTCGTHGTYTWKVLGLTSEAKGQLGLAVDV